MSAPSVLIKKSTGEILKHAPYPNIDMSPVIGLDPDMEWLVKYQPYDSPDYDRRIFELGITEEISTEDHPTYPGLKQFKRTYHTIKKMDEKIIEAIQSVENQVNEELVDFETKTKLLAIAVNALSRQQQGLILTQNENDALAQLAIYGEKIWKNDAEKKLKVKQVKDGLEPNIDEGWEKKVPTTII